MENTQPENPALGSEVGQASTGGSYREVSPIQNIPCYTPGKDWSANTAIEGVYVGTHRIYSQKFTAGKIDIDGRKFRDQHVMRDLAGQEFGLWSVGVLGNFFKQLPKGSQCKITYTGLAKEALQSGQNPPHEFKFELGEGVELDRSKVSKNTTAAH